MSSASFDELESNSPEQPAANALTRRLALLWLLAGLIFAGVFCYLLSTAFSSLRKDTTRLGAVADFAAVPVQTFFVNAEFLDPETNKAFTTLALDITTDGRGKFDVFFARSTLPFSGVQAPRQCVVRWDEGQDKFVDPCSGSRWTLDGRYVDGPAPRDLDRFPVTVKDGALYIELNLLPGAGHP